MVRKIREGEKGRKKVKKKGEKKGKKCNNICNLRNVLCKNDYSWRISGFKIGRKVGIERDMNRERYG